jgi:protein TonB
MTAAIDPELWGAAAKKTAGAGKGRAGRRRWLVPVLSLAVAVPLLGMAVSALFTKVDAPKHKSVVQIALLAPPPPPPPKPKEEPPPKPKEEVKIDQPKPTPDEPKPMPQAPPPGPIGVDAQGTGPGDSFGLAGRPGGRDIIGSGGGGGGLSLGLFGSSTARHIAQELARDPRLKSASYKVELRVWLSKDGRFERGEIVHGSGDAEIDRLIREGLRQVGALQTAVPQNLPQPLRIRVTSTDA